ncbi:MAG: DUF4435 domain-containing protein [Alphaproteobacteria bacterium]|nr:DUF4435 domain-containing protein [Alphaproteobacteria bacterium]
MRLDQALGAARVKYWQGEGQRARGKSVILVEGEDDQVVLETLFSSRHSTWATRIAVVPCGGREKVRRALAEGRLPENLPSNRLIIGLVDRDTWDAGEQRTAVALTAGQLFVTRGWCLENAFLDHRVWGTVVPDRESEVAIHDALDEGLADQVAAGVWRWTLQRKRDQMNQVLNGLPGFRDPSTPLPDLDDAGAVQRALAALHGAGADLEPAPLARVVVETWQQWRHLPGENQWRDCVDGKEAFRGTLVPLLNQTVRGQGEDSWRLDLAPALRQVEPFNEICALLGL